jgi:hypothetical protein
VLCCAAPCDPVVLCCAACPLQGLPDSDVVRVLIVCIMKSINLTGKNQMQIMQVGAGDRPCGVVSFFYGGVCVCGGGG